MKILHFNVFKHLLPGIKHQLIDEQRAAEALSTTVEWTTVVFSLDAPTLPFMKQVLPAPRFPLPPRLNNYLQLKTQAYNWLLENQHRFDLILLRYSPGDPFLLLSAKKIQRFITIHHTLEHHESRSSGGIIGTLHSKLEQITAPHILSKTEGVVGVTDEIRQYEVDRIIGTKPSFTCPNGISIEPQKHLNDQRGQAIKIAFIASTFVPWHGLDRVLEQFKRSDLPIEMEVIGDAPATLNIDDRRITYHGTLNKDQITSILHKVDLGLSCFALDRKGMQDACTLKVREYLSNGIPVFANHRDSALPEDFPYYINRPFSLECIYEKAKVFKTLSRSQVRDASIPYIDKEKQMQALLSWIDSITPYSTT